MDVEFTVLTGLAALAAFLLAPSVTAGVDAGTDRMARRSILRSVAVAAASAVCWLVVAWATSPQLDPRLPIPVAGLAGFAASLVTITLRHRHLLAVVATAVAWTAAVFSPVAVALFSTTDGLLGSGLRTLDLGGASAVLVTAGCGIVCLLILDRRTAVDEPGPPRPLVVPLFAVVWVLWIVWLVGLELVIDDVTPRILVNAVIAPVVAAAGWLVVQRIRHARTTAAGAVAGLFCGLVAVTAGCGYLDPLGAVLTGGIAGVTCSLIGYGLVRRTGRTGWLIAIVLVVGASIGVVLLGAFATRSGLMFTGQPEVLFSQFASVIAVVVYSAAVSLAIWIVARRVGRGRRAAAAGRRLQRAGRRT